jgi:hypothetical protein
VEDSAGCIDIFAFAITREVSSRPEAKPKWRDPRILPEQPDTSCEEIHSTGIPKYGGFSTPQDENAVLLRSK